MVRRFMGPRQLFAWLDHRVSDRMLVGGKGASLSCLARLGAPVPRAGALTTVAYTAFAGSIGLLHRPTEVAIADLPRIHDQFMTAPLPEAVADTLASVFHAFQAHAGSDLALAVRSSATAEDSAAFSFAGLHDSILDVRTLADLETAVRQCWASLWSERAVAYRRASGLGDEDAAIAVVIQQLVRSDVSFVVFTTDPVSGNGDHLVISASWGLGEAIVSGIVTPDHIVVGADGEILQYTPGAKHRMVIPGAGPDAGTREVAVPRALQTLPALTHEQVAAIAAMARSLSRRLGYEADVEGGIAGDQIFLFQARPITTLVSGTIIPLSTPTKRAALVPA
jgi:pyruvate,water dikinase